MLPLFLLALILAHTTAVATNVGVDTSTADPLQDQPEQPRRDGDRRLDLKPDLKIRPTTPNPRRLNCADDDAGLIAAVKANPQTAPHATMLSGCAALPGLPAPIGNGCVFAVFAEIATDHCPKTCLSPACAAALTCPAPNVTEDNAANGATSNALPPCWDVTTTDQDLFDNPPKQGHKAYSGPKLTFTGQVSDPTNTSSCKCADYPYYSDPFMKNTCEDVYALYLSTHAPKCLKDTGGYVSDKEMADTRRLCPLSCGVCAGAPKTRRDGALRGASFKECLIDTDSASGTPITLDGKCTLCSNVTVRADTSLHVKGSSPSAPATISGGDATRHFNVFGELSLEDIILRYGFSGTDGGAILIGGTDGTALASARLLRTTILDCEAYGSGGGVAVFGNQAKLELKDGVAFEQNVAKKGSGGAIYVDRGGQVEVISSPAPVEGIATKTTIVVTGQKNTAGTAGGFLMARHGSNITISGQSVAVLLTDKNRAPNGGAMAITEGAVATIEKGASFTASRNEAGHAAGGAIILKGDGAELVVRDTGTTVTFEENCAAISGGAVHASSGGTFSFLRGARVLMVRNVCKLYGQGMSLDAAFLFVEGRGTKLEIEGCRHVLTGFCILESSHKGGSRNGGGLNTFTGSRVVMKAGAEIEIRHHAVWVGGGGLAINDGSLKVSGKDTQVSLKIPITV
jgi:predicted outer membrane repeat protein